MKIGVISDTHGDVAMTRRSLEILDRYGVGLTIHCGDVGLAVVSLFDGRRVHFVAGNTDDPDELRLAIYDADHKLHDEPGALEIEGRHVAFLHGHDVNLLAHTVHCGHWHLVCHGHTHAALVRREGPTLVVNPGAISRTHSPSLAIVELPSMEVTEVSL
jgi:uncharacterized protein